MRIETVEDFLRGVVNTKESVAFVLRDNGRILLSQPDMGSGLVLDAQVRAIAQGASGVSDAKAVLDGARRIHA